LFVLKIACAFSPYLLNIRNASYKNITIVRINYGWKMSVGVKFLSPILDSVTNRHITLFKTTLVKKV